MGQAPVPARFQDRFARPGQLAEEARISLPAVPLNPCLLQLGAALILRAEHTILLVNVDPNVVHKNSSFPFPQSLRSAKLFSCYLTPFVPYIYQGIVVVSPPPSLGAAAASDF